MDNQEFPVLLDPVDLDAIKTRLSTPRTDQPTQVKSDNEVIVATGISEPASQATDMTTAELATVRSKLASYTPEIAATRNAVADQIMRNRARSRIENMTVGRNSEEYIRLLGGLKQTTEYGKGLTQKRWLDIGAGKTLGIAQLADSEFGQGMAVEATTLFKDPEIEKHLGFDRTRITPAETLLAIPDNSVSVITALNSVAYSVAPQMTVDSIDRVLEDGGVFQGTFQDPDNAPAYDPMNPVDEFQRAFEEKGYDIAVKQHPDESSGLYILTAVKRGGTITAQQLLDENLASVPPPETIPSDQARLQDMAQRGFNMGLDLLKDRTEEGIERFVHEELVGRQGFDTNEAALAQQKLKERFLN